MAIRQYIGARYVPKFYENPNNTAEWLPNVTYEPLTIVTYGPNTYTSKKFVPASIGDPGNNPLYWVCTSNYNAFIKELQAEIDDINDNLDVVTGKVNILNKISNARNIILVGDSWGNGQYATHGWCYYLDDLLEDSTVYTAAANGAGFVGYNNVTYLSTLQAIENTVTDKDGIELILVGGGLNDQGESGVSAAITSFMTYVNTTYPNAIVLNVALNNYIGHSTNDTMDMSYLSEYASFNGYQDKYYFVNKINTAPYKLYVNNNHLTNEGNEVVAKMLYGLIRGFSDYNKGYTEYNGTAFKNTTMTGSELSITVSSKEYNDCYFASIGSITIGTYTPTGFLTTEDFDATSDVLFPFNANDYSHVALASASINGESAVTFPVVYRFTGPKKLTLSMLNFGRGNNVTYTNLYIFATTVIVPKSIY